MTSLFDDPPDKCPTCLRPFHELDAHQRARGGSHPGVEAQAARLNEDPRGKCMAVLVALRMSSASIGSQGWVSAAHLRMVLDGGDGPRRARQLRDEYGFRIEVEMRSEPRQAWYRLLDPERVSDDMEAAA